MKLPEIFQRDMDPQPWAEGEKIPWHDPDFSRRMLKEHLSQKHDAASRRTPTIKKHVDWIHSQVLNKRPSRILDLGCGPGFYTSRLSALGHACHGIDFSPASIEYAVENAPETCSYTLGDFRTTDYGAGHDLVMLIFGEFNVFKPEDAVFVLEKAFSALKPGGRLLLEVITAEAVYQSGNQPATWYTAENDLFADEPHLVLMESFWNDEQSVAIERYYIADSGSGVTTRYSISTQAYEEIALAEMLIQAGYQKPDFYPSLAGEPDSLSEMVALVASK